MLKKLLAMMPSLLKKNQSELDKRELEIREGASGKKRKKKKKNPEDADETIKPNSAPVKLLTGPSLYSQLKEEERCSSSSSSIENSKPTTKLGRSVLKQHTKEMSRDHSLIYSSPLHQIRLFLLRHYESW